MLKNNKSSINILVFAFIVLTSISVFVFASISKFKTNTILSAAGLAGDADGNGKVDIVDIGIIIDNYSRNPIPNRNADINADGRVDIVDIGITIDNYGKTGTGGNGSTGHDQLKALVDAYAASHPGKTGDVTVKTDSELSSDSAGRQLVDVCGPGQRPVYPKLAWDYGAAGGDVPWSNPQSSALVYCVYIPTATNSEHWSFNPSTGRVKADMYIKFPDQNPCNNRTGKDQLLGCLGDPGNIEILITTISLDDGHRVGLELSEASTELYLIMPNGSKEFVLLNL